jgi:hypothetical protein
MVDYIKYLKNNPQGYWFKRKLYGWGWVPAKWQGWLVLLVWVILFTFSMIMIEENDHEIGRNLAVTFIITLILIWICYKKGEKPKWSWGK